MPEFELPEFTRSLRALAVPSAPGSDHDLVFAPLIQARTTAHRATSMEAQMAAFDAQRLERGWRAAIATLAQSRHKRSAPDQRALAAELELLADPLWSALAAMRAAVDAARQVRPADAAARRAAWEAWVETVRHVFRAADDWWRAASTALGDSTQTRGAAWRRLARRPR
jgi:hypothetical protein